MAHHCRPLIRGKELGHAIVLIKIFAEPLYYTKVVLAGTVGTV